MKKNIQTRIELVKVQEIPEGGLFQVILGKSEWDPGCNCICKRAEIRFNSGDPYAVGEIQEICPDHKAKQEDNGYLGMMSHNLKQNKLFISLGTTVRKISGSTKKKKVK